MVVCADADLDEAVNLAGVAVFTNNGELYVDLYWVALNSTKGVPPGPAHMFTNLFMMNS